MARLNAAARDALPGEDFAGPHRSFPIENESHARDALARAADASDPGEIRAEVKTKYPNMKVMGEKLKAGHYTPKAPDTKG